MTILGRDPNSTVGDSFHRNIWNWSALWGYCASVSPEAASLGTRAYVNDGDGLDAEGAKKLAAILREQLASGATQNAVKEVEEFEVAPPTPPAIEALLSLQAVGGTFFSPRAQFSEDDVCDFAEFLEHSGGFDIH